MTTAQVQLENGCTFNEREWLRRETLWASLVVPYNLQMITWYNGTVAAQHSSNISRAELFASMPTYPDMQARAFQNQGKSIGAAISSSVLFRLFMRERIHNDQEITTDTLTLQAKGVDIAIGHSAMGWICVEDDGAAYANARRVALLAENPAQSGDFVRRHRLLYAAKIMSGLARTEIQNWRAMPQPSSHPLIVQDGGTPRSGGAHIESLQRKFHTIVESADFRSLATIEPAA